MTRGWFALAILCTACAGTPPSTPSVEIPVYTVRPALSTPFAYGVASGDMAQESAVLWTRTAGPGTVVAELSSTPGFEATHTLAPAAALASSDFTVKVVADGLQPGTRYYYRFKGDGYTSAVGTFRTAYAPTQSAAVRMAFTGDADWKWKPYPILSALSQENLDFFLFLGDLIYETLDYPGETVVEDLEGYRFKYRDNREPRAGSPGGGVPMRDLYSAFGQYSVFDNHEIGYSSDEKAPPYTEGGAPFAGGFVNKTPGYRARIRAYREYQPVREDVHATTGDALADGTDRFYRAYAWGANVELIVLDDRSYRGPRVKASDDPAAASCDRTMLGPTQLKWFEETLLAAKARNVVWKVVVVSSPIQEFGGKAQVGVDMEYVKSWVGAYRCERNRILAFIDRHAIDNVVFLTTDNHYTAINNLVYDTVPDNPRSPRRPARNAFEIMTGPLGAITGPPPYGRMIDLTGLARREADRKILAVWHGEAPDADGKVLGLMQSGMDPIGLEAGFPGLDVASIRSAGGRPGVAEPLAFASFQSFGYAVLTFDQSHLHVQVKTMASVPDPATLLKADALREYESRKPEETFSFSVRAR